MLNLGTLLGLLLTLVALGFAGIKTLKNTEKEMAKVAIEAHKKNGGYISIKGFHQRLINGR